MKFNGGEYMRDCGDCTACCEGWLLSEKMALHPGSRCSHCTDNGCGIYDERPEISCRSFECSWLLNHAGLPTEARPDLSGVILAELGEWGQWPVFSATPTSAAMRDSTFTWLKSWCLEQNVAILFTELELVDGEFTGRGQQKTFGPPSMLVELASGGNAGDFWALTRNAERL